MNLKFLPFLLICLFLFACEDKDKPDNSKKYDRTETQAWIEDTMRKHYYWYREIPKADALNYKLEPDPFFKSLLTKKDGKTKNGEHNHYSYIEELSKDSRSLSQTDYTYGFEFTGVFKGETKEILTLIRYVVPNSPAEEAGLKRGDWIEKINNAPITESNYASFLGSKACTLSILRWDDEKNSLIAWPEEIKLPSARKVEDNPILVDSVLSSPLKKKQVGYLVYNHFTDGKEEKDTSYDDQLRKLSGEFFKKGVEEFVLDLRYNNGGLLSSAMLLCAILAPQDALGKDFGYLEYNDKQASPKKSFKVTSSLLSPEGKNLNLKTLYVLTSSASASASEMVINSLRPFMNVVIIGERTEGKNVGSVPYKSDDKQWEMHPIVCQIYNSKDFTGYENGFAPDHEMDEAFEPVDKNTVRILPVRPLGDPEERLLHAALSIIDGTYIAGSRSSSPIEGVYQKTNFQSIDRKATHAVIINNQVQ